MGSGVVFIGSCFVLGLFAGAFLNRAVVRLLRNEPVSAAFRCVRCRSPLRFVDRMPIVGSLRHKGRCRYCQANVSPQSFWVETCSGVAFALLAYHFGAIPELVVALLFVSILLVVVQTDIRASIIPNKVVYFGIGAIALLRLIIHELPLWNYVTAFLLCAGVLLLLAWLSKGGMGGGDIKLFALIGLVLGLIPALLALVISSLLGILYGLMLVIKERKYLKGKFIPFGPFIALGAMIAYLWGEPMLRWAFSWLAA